MCVCVCETECDLEVNYIKKQDINFNDSVTSQGTTIM